MQLRMRRCVISPLVHLAACTVNLVATDLRNVREPGSFTQIYECIVIVLSRTYSNPSVRSCWQWRRSCHLIHAPVETMLHRIILANVLLKYIVTNMVYILTWHFNDREISLDFAHMLSRIKKSNIRD